VAKNKKRGGEHLLLPAGEGGLTLQDLESRCARRLARLLSDTTDWSAEGKGGAWTIGDFRILIVETTMAPEAVLYVQFWSEPDQAVCWEVSSGHRNRGARRFVTRQARRLLADMDFRVRGEARNFGKTATISNKADAAAVARDVLRILHDGFGYTGETALVAKTIASGRSEQAVVHTGLTPDDTVTLLRRLGCETELQKHEQGPVVFAQWEGFRFVATLAVADDAGVFRCLDLTAIVGQASNATMSAWAAEVNELNAASRVARAWLDGEGSVAVGTSFCLHGGLTEAFLAEQIGSWRHAAAQIVGGPHPPKDQEDSSDEEGEDEEDSEEVLH
jgi:hypothetical protein